LLQGEPLSIKARLLPSGISKATKASWPVVSMHIVVACNPRRDALEGCLYPLVNAVGTQDAQSSYQDRSKI